MKLALQLSYSKTVTDISMKFWGLGSFSGRNRHVRNADTSNIKEDGGGVEWRKENRRMGI